ncbi:hypothetical protein [Alkaliphilus sp. B6464]|uniref:hypothetical protein n=1 Tax=Alkaliphilus sp. B6464 TaxID=2731219 RepID=UPI001BAC4169|nr:hypothetical protein [Alkaliphilus sp. B6464]QUH21748.1 hypothetical protein HYG84_17585 [Alkaliphilus sp. B6464]
METDQKCIYCNSEANMELEEMHYEGDFQYRFYCLNPKCSKEFWEDKVKINSFFLKKI